MRKLTQTLAVVSLLAPVDSYPLGIGNIKLNSALNQILNAEIALSLDANENIGDIRVSLASPEKFDDAGVVWTASLAKIKFAPVANANGKAVIRLTSEEVIQEPFLSILVKIEWPKGSQYREYTVLVDPPTTYMQPVVSIANSAPITYSQQGSDFTASYNQSAANQTSSDSNRVKVNDTLWQIAERVNAGRTSSIEQMMVALYKANPQAFYKDNVNALSAGAILNVPDNNSVLSLSANQARKEFYRQNNAWRNRTSDAYSTPSKPKNQLVLVAPEAAGIDQQATIVNAAESTPIQSGVSGQVSPENAAFAERLADLERRLAAMQLKLAIKNQELAAFQSGATEPEVTAMTTDAPELAVTEPPVEIVPTPVAVATPIEVKAPSEKPEVKPAVVKPPVVKPEPVKSSEPKVETESSDSPYFMWLAIILALLGGLVGWLWWRKRQIDNIAAEESMFSSAFTATPDAELTEISQMNTAPVSDDLSYQTGTIGESSILSEFTPSDFDAFETEQSEVDPISEADVYLAYGRYQQAEELMRQAITDLPDRDECKLKLLEIFYANENAQDFETYANELKASGKDQDPEFWGRVVEMGSEVCSGSSLFGDSESQAGDSVFATTDKVSSPAATEQVATADDLKLENEEVTGGVEFDSSIAQPEAVATEIEDNKESLSVSDDQASENEFEDIDLGGIELDDSEQTAGGEIEEIEFDFDMNFEVDESESADNVEELVDMDAMETKIDLARAYFDMGDEESTKAIAEEVLENGNDAQKKEAQKILDSIK